MPTCRCYFCQPDSPSTVLTSSPACQGLPQECCGTRDAAERGAQPCQGIPAVGAPGVQVHHQVLWKGAPSPL